MANEELLSRQQQYRSMKLSDDFSDEEMARDWTLSESDKAEIAKYRKNARLWMAVQLCTIRLYGRFIHQTHDVSTRILNYLGKQLNLPPSLGIQLPEREATYLEHRKKLLIYLGFTKFDENAQSKLEGWLIAQAQQGQLPDDLFQKAESHLLAKRILLPGATVLERLIIHICAETHKTFFKTIDQKLPAELKVAINNLLKVSEGQQRSYFQKFKDYPPEASISSLKTYLNHYEILLKTGIDQFEAHFLEPTFLEFFFKQAKRYNATDLKRFNEHKRYGLMICFLLETRKQLLDYLVKMHDQYISDMTRKSKNAYEKQRRKLRKQKKKAIDIVLFAGNTLVDWPEDKAISKQDFWHKIDESKFKESLTTLRLSKELDEQGYGNLLLARYPSLRKYFAIFLHLPFTAEQGSESLMEAIQTIRHLDSDDLKKLPTDVSTNFVSKELWKVLRNNEGQINRNAWETALALAIKDALRSGNLYLPKSKQHVSFWKLMLSETRWKEIRTKSFNDLQLPQATEAKVQLAQNFHQVHATAKDHFPHDSFATIIDGKLKLKRNDKLILPNSVSGLQRVIDSHMPLIRIEQLLMEVDRLTGFSKHFKPIQGHQARPPQFYKSLIASIVSQATNLGVVSMSASMKDTSVDMLRRILQYFISEENLKAASAEIVNRHHELPLSNIYGSGNISSSDAQRFKIRASSLLASYYPRYYGYYEKAIGIYTHVSDQYSVFNTKAISCSPREALYVLDGLLENNTVLQIQAHTTDTHGYTEIIFALCYLLGYDFMPRIRDLKDQQLYKVDRHYDYGIFTPLLTKTADSNIVEEQWEEMVRAAVSLKERISPAHIVVQRLINNFPADRLSKAFTNLGRIIKTQYILRYLTDKKLRQTVQLQLNKPSFRTVNIKV